MAPTTLKRWLGITFTILLITNLFLLAFHVYSLAVFWTVMIVLALGSYGILKLR